MAWKIAARFQSAGRMTGDFYDAEDNVDILVDALGAMYDVAWPDLLPCLWAGRRKGLI